MLFSRPWPEATEIDVGGRAVSVAVRVHKRARHYRLSVSGLGQPVLTVPATGRWPEAQKFLEKQTAWLEARLKRAIEPVPFVDGAQVPLRGVTHTIKATGVIRGVTHVQEDQSSPQVLVSGTQEHLTRRVHDWLKREAKADLEASTARHAANLGVSVKAIVLRDPSSRWGSCAHTGRLNFSWRLVMAPPHVLDYVAAHEVAHLLEMNHSPAFWDAVRRTLPDMARGRSWLKAHGRSLMAYGRKA